MGFGSQNPIMYSVAHCCRDGFYSSFERCYLSNRHIHTTGPMDGNSFIMRNSQSHGLAPQGDTPSWPRVASMGAEIERGTAWWRGSAEPPPTQRKSTKTTAEIVAR